MLDINEIMERIPHRYPFLLVDKILEIEEGKRAMGLKNVTINEPFFQGHFPGYPVMPGALILESLAQVGAVAVLSLPENKGKLGMFVGVDKFKFKSQVKPGDTLTLEAEMLQMRMNIGKAKVKASVDGKMVAGGEISFAIV
ncbi:MAG: 3-hydroxyacyl-ACP dehydratase FabZ [Clostridia bacterium]|nr:3-hydroxyacyl-ACP dehydratase FabZ [Clostridia bacterium]